MNLRDLEYVIAVAQHQNFTRAAQAAAVSQPALSNQIKKLETELGVPIFQRGKDGVQLTNAGREVLEKAKQIAELVEAIGDVARKHQSTDTQPIRLGMTPTLAAYLSRYFHDLFARITPERRVVITEAYPVNLAKMVEERSVDFAFFARKTYESLVANSGSALNFQSLWLEPVYLATRVNHPLTERKSIWAHQVPADLLIRFHVSFGYELEHDLPPASDISDETTGIDVKTARFETVCRHVAQSDACTMVNAIAAEQFKHDGFGLAFIPFNDEGNIRELGIISRAQYPDPELLKALEDSVCQTPPKGTVASCRKQLLGETATASL